MFREAHVFAGQAARHQVGRRLAEQLVLLGGRGRDARQSQEERQRKRSKTRVQCGLRRN